jgi:hypothetical protein
MPVRGLGYSTGRDVAALPGALIAIGVISILWGLFQAAGGAVATAVVMPAYRQSVPPPPPAPRPLPPVRVTPHPGDYVRDTGLKAADRAAVVEGLRQKTRLSPDRLALVERFLADAGREIFPSSEPLTAQSVASAVLSTGKNSTGPDGSGDLATDFFTTAFGRVEVDNVAISFTPKSGGPGAGPRRRAARDEGDGNVVHLDPSERGGEKVGRELAGAVGAARVLAGCEDRGRDRLRRQRLVRRKDLSPHVREKPLDQRQPVGGQLRLLPQPLDNRGAVRCLQPRLADVVALVRRDPHRRQRPRRRRRRRHRPPVRRHHQPRRHHAARQVQEAPEDADDPDRDQ